MRVLIVSPHFPPTNAADMQRVRMILPYFADAGVRVEVLAVSAEQVASPLDPWLEEGIPDSVPVHRVNALSLRWGWIPGFQSLYFRSIGALKRAGDAVLAGQHFDLVYFSTTLFGITSLGVRWKRRFGVPFVMDYQDPWVSDYYQKRPDVAPPGGRLKYGVASWLARRLEPRVLRECAGISSVSPSYPRQLGERYGGNFLDESTDSSVEGKGVTRDDCLFFSQWEHYLRCLVVPFPGDPKELERARSGRSQKQLFVSTDGLKHWVYVGRGGPDMAKSVRGLFRAIAQMPNEKLKSLRLHFIGTSYAVAGRGEKTIEPIASEFGLEEIIFESPDRIPYRDTLRHLLAADALFVPGSDDPGYTASKIYPYLLAEKPLLAVFHEKSSVADLINRVGGGRCVTFCRETSERVLGNEIAEIMTGSFPLIPAIPLRMDRFEPYLAPAQARKLKNFFQLCEKGAESVSV